MIYDFLKRVSDWFLVWRSFCGIVGICTCVEDKIGEKYESVYIAPCR